MKKPRKEDLDKAAAEIERRIASEKRHIKRIRAKIAELRFDITATKKTIAMYRRMKLNMYEEFKQGGTSCK